MPPAGIEGRSWEARALPTSPSTGMAAAPWEPALALPAHGSLPLSGSVDDGDRLVDVVSTCSRSMRSSPGGSRSAAPGTWRTSAPMPHSPPTTPAWCGRRRGGRPPARRRRRLDPAPVSAGAAGRRGHRDRRQREGGRAVLGGQGAVGRSAAQGRGRGDGLLALRPARPGRQREITAAPWEDIRAQLHRTDRATARPADDVDATAVTAGCCCCTARPAPARPPRCARSPAVADVVPGRLRARPGGAVRRPGYLMSVAVGSGDDDEQRGGCWCWRTATS